MKPQILFVHEGKAAYPEIEAYRAFFADAYETDVVSPDRVGTRSFAQPTILWHMMGLYPRLLGDASCVTVHDYRSLSVGRLSRAKDFLKRIVNARPSLRLFQNQALCDAMGFRDGVPSALVPMGVPVFPAAGAEDGPAPDFCYAGAMSRERNTHWMIDSFVRRFGKTRRLTLFGEPEPWLPARYRGVASVVFAGRLPQDRLFNLLRRARCCVNYFPHHYPHLLQTPTKLLEYASLGCRILSNDHPASRDAVQAYGIATRWGQTRDLFAGLDDAVNWPDNTGLDAKPFSWEAVLTRSLLREKLATIVP